MPRPRVLLLDEPTSGLDAFAAAVVMGHVADLAAGRGWHATETETKLAGGGGMCGGGGVTVLASLHQPRAAIWERVDQV
jgi:ATP-binding cassette subfamily G (WHITE) protein 2